jgi:hypothetical protein
MTSTLQGEAQFIPVVHKSRVYKRSGYERDNDNNVSADGIFSAHSANTRDNVLCFYVGNIKKTLTENDVKSYFERGGLDLKFQKIIETKKHGSGNGVKIGIYEYDYQKLSDFVFPAGIYVRKWHVKERLNY